VLTADRVDDESNLAGLELDFSGDAASALAEANVASIEANALSSAEATRTPKSLRLISAIPPRSKIAPLIRKTTLEGAIKEHSAL
jgi:hypothetical protein